jgi:hypothetical protein
MKKGGKPIVSEHGHNTADPDRNLEIDVTLALLCRIRRKGVEIPGRVIGELCGLSHAGICAIQQRALRKLRQNPKFHLLGDGLQRRDFAA